MNGLSRYQLNTSGSLIFSMVMSRREVWLERVCSQLLVSWRQGCRGTISSQYLAHTQTQTNNNKHIYNCLTSNPNEEAKQRQ